MSDLLNRKGTFKITRDLIESNPEVIIDLLKDILVVKIDSDFMYNSLHYYGYSKHFDLLEDGEFPPEYIAEITGKKGQINNLKWKRINDYSDKDVKSILNEILEKLNKKG